MTRRRAIAYGSVVAGILFLQWSCALIYRSLRTGGREQLKPVAYLFSFLNGPVYFRKCYRTFAAICALRHLVNCFNTDDAPTESFAPDNPPPATGAGWLSPSLSAKDFAGGLSEQLFTHAVIGVSPLGAQAGVSLTPRTTRTWCVTPSSASGMPPASGAPSSSTDDTPRATPCGFSTTIS